MQKVRGFIFLEGKNAEDIRKSFNGFRMDSLNYVLFDNFKKNDKLVEGSGIFIYGEIDSKYSSEDIINLLRKHEDLQEAEFEKKQLGEVKHYKPLLQYDVSVENEDFMREIKKGNTIGNYIGLRIKPPFNIVEIQDITKHMNILTKAKDIYVRCVEVDEDYANATGQRKPKACIELIIEMAFEDAMKKIQEVYGNRLKISEITTAKLFI